RHERIEVERRRDLGIDMNAAELFVPLEVLVDAVENLPLLVFGEIEAGHRKRVLEHRFCIPSSKSTRGIAASTARPSRGASWRGIVSLLPHPYALLARLKSLSEEPPPWPPSARACHAGLFSGMSAPELRASRSCRGACSDVGSPHRAIR